MSNTHHAHLRKPISAYGGYTLHYGVEILLWHTPLK